MIYEHADIRTFLSAEYTRLADKNSRYSLRAFAGKLGLAPSMLSEVLSGKKNISQDMAIRIGEALNLSTKELEYFVLLSEKKLTKSEKRKSQIYERLKSINNQFDFLDLDVESFQMISEWYHFPILELCGRQGLVLDSKLVAKKLGISAVQVSDAIQRLLNLKLIKKENNKFTKTKSGGVRASSKVHNEALRKYHDTMLDIAKSCLKNQDPSERFVGSETLRFDEKDLEQAGEIFEECFQKIIDLSKRCQNPVHVFHMGIQFYSITKGDKK